MSAKVALQLNAILGVATTMAASAIMWLVLTRPADVAATIAQHDYDALVVAVARQLGAWMHAVLQFV